METEFVTVVVTSTGRKQRVPAHYLDNPVLSRGIKLPPSARGDDAPPTSEPSEAWTRAQLDERATALGINPADFRTKADVLDAITNHQTSTPTPGEDETPATGDEKE